MWRRLGIACPTETGPRGGQCGVDGPDALRRSLFLAGVRFEHLRQRGRRPDIEEDDRRLGREPVLTVAGNVEGNITAATISSLSIGGIQSHNPMWMLAV